MTLWKPDPNTFSVEYPIGELLRRASTKVTIWDRDVPLAYTGGGFFHSMVGKLINIKNWQKEGIKTVRVYYQPDYFLRNANSVRLLDPIHQHHVIKYEGSR